MAGRDACRGYSGEKKGRMRNRIKYWKELEFYGNRRTGNEKNNAP